MLKTPHPTYWLYLSIRINKNVLTYICMYAFVKFNERTEKKPLVKYLLSYII